MSNNPEKIRTRRLSSILKTVGGNSGGDSPTMTFSRRSKRISFNHVKNVKEFVADIDNQTIWGNSYEKTVNAVGGASSSSDPNITSVTCVTSNQHSQNESAVVAAAPVIELFADIVDGSDDDGDVEMKISFEPTQPVSLHSKTQFLDQTMFIDETAATTSMTNCQTLDMSFISSTNKRKTNDTISMDEATVPLKKSVKIRKTHNREIQASSIPVLQKYNKIDRRVKIDSIDSNNDSASLQSVNLDVTRIYDVDDSIINDLSNDQPSSQPESKITNKTTTCTADMTVDDQSMICTMSDISKPNVNKTQFFGRDDISAGIDQTFLVRNPMQENNFTEPKTVETTDDAHETNVEEFEMENDLPAFQSKFGNANQPILHDVTATDIQYKYKYESNLRGFQSTLGNTEEIEDLTISMDTNFKAEVSDEHDKTRHETSLFTKDSEPEELQRSPSFYHAKRSIVFENNKMNSCHDKENMSTNVLELPPINYTNSPRQETLGISEDMSLCSIAKEVKVNATRHGKITSPALLQSPQNPTYMTNNNKMSNTTYLDSSGAQDNHSLVTTNITFGYSEPLSSTRVAPNKTLNFTHNDGIDVTFNYCPAARQSRGLRSAASSQNNTDELCNLEPGQSQKRIDMKKLFLDITNAVPQDMLSETKLDLIGESCEDEFVINESHREDLDIKSETKKQELNVMIKEEPPSYLMDEEFATKKLIKEECVAGKSTAASVTIKKEVSDDLRCRKCLNCRKSLDGNNLSFVKIENLDEPQLDFSVYNQFKGLASFKDVIEARKKRYAVKELQKQLLVDQNVEAPDIRFLWENNNATEALPVCTPTQLTCLPMRMSIQFLMNNKMQSEYTKWKYFDNFFYIGAIVLRHEKVPSIKIHIKFDKKGVKTAEELNIPLLFKRVFIEECPVYLKKISPRNYLKHKHALSLLPLNLSTMLSDSENIYRGLDEIDVLFEKAVAKVNELDMLTVECEAFLKMEDRQCSIEKSVFDIEKYLMQEFVIKLDRIDDVGPTNVYFKPTCETTNEFKNLPIGLPFLRNFLVNPKSYLLPFLQS